MKQPPPEADRAAAGEADHLQPVAVCRPDHLEGGERLWESSDLRFASDFTRHSHGGVVRVGEPENEAVVVLSTDRCLEQQAARRRS